MADNTQQTSAASDTAFEDVLDMDQFVASLGLEMRVNRARNNPNMPDKKMIHWQITLAKGNSEMVFYFSTGGAWIKPIEKIKTRYGKHGLIGYADIKRAQQRNAFYDPEKDQFMPTHGGISTGDFEALQIAYELKKPSLTDVLECLANDAGCVEYSNFEDFCGNLGYDPDSMKARKIYDTINEQTNQLRGLIGSEAFNILRGE